MKKKTNWFYFYIIGLTLLANITLLWINLTDLIPNQVIFTSISIIIIIIVQGAILIKSKSLEKEVKKRLIKVVSATIIGCILLLFIPFLFQHI
ncbi:hypothetical protein COE50_27540 [Bacillus anthracis]|nr:hypothetical protein COE50_27540 [Bacillus anthracis]